MISFSTIVLALGLLSSSTASPTPQEGAVAISEILPGTIIDDILSGLDSIPAGVAADASQVAVVYSAFLTAIEDTVASSVTATPTDIAGVTSVLASVFSATPTVLLDNVLELITNGITLSPDELDTLITGAVAPENSYNNVNPREPATTIYPRKDCNDAPYSLTESQLRAAIYIPDTFTYGQKPPVILVPGTGTTGYQTFDGNYIPLLQDKPYADLVWLNIPIQLLGDVQVNAEYVAYAINYINGITARNVSIISWSQGGLDSQWAFKYWPSTRSVTTGLIAQSPDFHGTVLAYALCPDFPTLPCPPSIIQQEYSSNFINTLRANGGDSAYVPTTTIFSATDEVVQPQTPVEDASAFLLDARNVGVTNNQVQAICPGQPAGSIYTHEGILYNPLGYALTIDALMNSRPGQVSTTSLATVCQQIVSPGLDLEDVLITEESIEIAVVSIVLYPNKVFVEPPIMQYALSPPSSSACSSSSSTTASAPSSSSGSATVSATVSGSTSPGIHGRSLTESSTSHSYSPTASYGGGGGGGGGGGFPRQSSAPSRSSTGAAPTATGSSGGQKKYEEASGSLSWLPGRPSQTASASAGSWSTAANWSSPQEEGALSTGKSCRRKNKRGAL